jgi:transcriptional regulator with XRE-family HTH domain
VKRTQAQVLRNLADFIKTRRAKVGLSQEALALAADVDRSYISQIERGIGNPSIKVMVSIANELGVDVGELLTRR